MKKILLLTFFAASLQTLLAQWVTKDSLKIKRQEMPAVLLDKKIYIMGGIAANAVTLSSMERYNPSTNSWDTVAPMPATRHHHCAAVANNKIYVFGGYDNVLFKARNEVYEYNPITNTWLAKDTLPQKIGASDAVEFNGKIYLFGGATNANTLRTTYVYDPIQNTWSQKASFNIAREHLAAAVIGNKIYVVSGRGSQDAETALEVYDPATDSWQPLQSLPTARSGIDAAVVAGRLLVFGGEGNGAVFAQCEAYDPVSNTWQTLSPMPNARHGLTSTAIGDTIYTIGGGIKANLGASNINEAYIVPLYNNIGETNEKASIFYYDRSNKNLVWAKDAEEQNQAAEIGIYTITGQEVFKGLVNKNHVFPCTFLPTGFYFATHQTSNSRSSFRFLVE